MKSPPAHEVQPVDPIGASVPEGHMLIQGPTPVALMMFAKQKHSITNTLLFPPSATYTLPVLSNATANGQASEAAEMPPLFEVPVVKLPSCP